MSLDHYSIENIVIIGGVLVALYMIYKFLSWNNKKRNVAHNRQQLMSKYGDNEVVEKIMSQTIWQGQTNEQVVESLGLAEDVDQKVLKTKKKEIWKYGFEGGNRYRLRITIENDVVVGWENR